MAADLGRDPAHLHRDVTTDPCPRREPVEPDPLGLATAPGQDPEVRARERGTRHAEADHDVECEMRDVGFDDRRSRVRGEGRQTTDDGVWRIADQQ